MENKKLFASFLMAALLLFSNFANATIVVAPIGYHLNALHNDGKLYVKAYLTSETGTAPLSPEKYDIYVSINGADKQKMGYDAKTEYYYLDSNPSEKTTYDVTVSVLTKEGSSVAYQQLQVTAYPYVASTSPPSTSPPITIENTNVVISSVWLEKDPVNKELYTLFSQIIHADGSPVKLSEGYTVIYSIYYADGTASKFNVGHYAHDAEQVSKYYYGSGFGGPAGTHKAVVYVLDGSGKTVATTSTPFTLPETKNPVEISPVDPQPQGARISSAWSSDFKVWVKAVASDGVPALAENGYKVTVNTGASDQTAQYDAGRAYYYIEAPMIYCITAPCPMPSYNAKVVLYKDGVKIDSKSYYLTTNGGSTQPQPQPTDPLPPETPQQTITLYSGWNMISTDFMLSVSEIKSSCDVQGSVWHYDSGLNGVQPGYSRISDMLSNGMGYWVKVGSTCKVPLHSTVQVPPTPTLYQTKYTMKLGKGWNQIGLPSGVQFQPFAYNAQESTCNLASGPWHYDAKMGQYAKSDMANLETGVGYWVKSNEECTLVFSPSEDQPPSPPSG